MTEGGGEKGMSKSPLSRLHVAKCQSETLAVGLDEVARNEMPSLTFLVLPREKGILLGFFIQRQDEAFRRRSHVGGRVVS